MAYCTIEQLTERYGSAMLLALSDRGDAAPTEPDTALLNRAIADAGARIDAYLLGRYALPLAEVPDVLRDIALRIAIYNAHGQVAVDKVTNDYKDALKDLEAIGKGTMRLAIAGVEPATSGNEGARITDRERPFTESNLKGWV